jgi:hypothetical protein
MWPSSGRCITKGRYIEKITVTFELKHRYKILNFKTNKLFEIYSRLRYRYKYM